MPPRWLAPAKTKGRFTKHTGTQLQIPGSKLHTVSYVVTYFRGEPSSQASFSAHPPPSPSSSHGPWLQHPAKLPSTAPLYLTSRPSGSLAVMLPTFVPLTTASLTFASDTCWKNCGASFTSVTISLKVAEELALYCTPGTRGSGFSAWTTILWMATVSKSRGCTGGKRRKINWGIINSLKIRPLPKAP